MQVCGVDVAQMSIGLEGSITANAISTSYTISKVLKAFGKVEVGLLNAEDVGLEFKGEVKQEWPIFP